MNRKRVRPFGSKDALRIDRRLEMAGLDPQLLLLLAEIAERTPVTLTLNKGLPMYTHIREPAA